MACEYIALNAGLLDEDSLRRPTLALLSHRIAMLVLDTHSGLFTSSPGVKACSGPTREKDELSEAGARVLVVSVTVSLSPGAYIKMNSLTLEKSLCFEIWESIDYRSNVSVRVAWVMG